MSKQGTIIWMTGRSGAGKTSIAEEAISSVKKFMSDPEEKRELKIKHLDGDAIRQELCRDLSFDAVSRIENHRRVLDVALLFAEEGYIVVVSMITPYRKLRKEIMHKCNEDFRVRKFEMVYVACSKDLCAWRDPKGLYAKGVDMPYEMPYIGKENFFKISTENVDRYLTADVLAKQIVTWGKL